MKNAVFWDVALCRSCVNRRFGGTNNNYDDDDAEILFSFILVFLSSLRLEMYRAHCGFVYKFGVLFLEHLNYFFLHTVSDKEKHVFPC
jgi:hypothetical protein